MAMTLLAATTKTTLLGRSNGTVQRIATRLRGADEFDGPILVNSLVVPVTEGSRLLETVLLQRFEVDGTVVDAGWCQTRKRWFVKADQLEII